MNYNMSHTYDDRQNTNREGKTKKMKKNAYAACIVYSALDTFVHTYAYLNIAEFIRHNNYSIEFRFFSLFFWSTFKLKSNKMQIVQLYFVDP